MDLSEINSAVGNAFGTKAKASTPAMLVGASDLADQISQLEAAKADMIPGSPSHTRTIADIAEAKKSLGGIKGAQPVAPAQSAPAQPAQPTSFADFKPENIDTAVQQAFTTTPGEEEKPTGVMGKVGQFLRGQGRSAASLADVGINAVTGMLDVGAYPLAKAYYGSVGGLSPEEASAKARAETTSPKDVIGRSLGITETPQYKGEASRQAMNYIGEHIGEGVDKIDQGLKSLGINLPKSDIENMVNQATFLVPGGMKAAAGTKVGKAVGSSLKQVGQDIAAGVSQETGLAGQAIKAITPAPIQRAAGAVTQGVLRGVEAVAPGTTNIKPAVTLAGPEQAAPYAGRVSAGAAAVPDAAMIQQALLSATPEFQNLYGAMPLDKLNMPVVLRHLEGDSLPVPVRLTEGQATGDLVKISKEMNQRGTPEGQPLAYRLNEQNKALAENVPAIREQAAPDVYSTKTIDSSEALIDAYKTLDKDRNAKITTAYKALEDANGGTFPVDGVQLAKNAEALLSKKLKSEFLPPSIKAQLERFKSGEPMTFEQFEAMRTNLAAEIRKAERSGDGNSSMASSLVRQALEDLPLTGDAAALKPLADSARNLAKSRFDALKQDPAYKAAVNETVPADKFLEKFVIRGVNKNVKTMVDTLGQDSIGHQHMKAGTINWLSDKAGLVEGKGNFSQANFNKALKSLDDVRNYEQIFDPTTQLQLKTLGNVANYTQFQPRGAYVNNSNTLVGYLANKGANLAEGAGNLAGLKFVGGVPVGTISRKFIQSRKAKTAVEKSLEPGAGSSLSDIKNQGQ